MIESEDLGPSVQSRKGRDGLGIHQDQPLDRIGSQLIPRDEREPVPVESQEVAEIAVQAPGQDRPSARIQLRCRQHGCQTVEIALLVGSDGIHPRFLTLPAILSRGWGSDNVMTNWTRLDGSLQARSPHASLHATSLHISLQALTLHLSLQALSLQ